MGIWPYNTTAKRPGILFIILFFSVADSDPLDPHVLGLLDPDPDPIVRIRILYVYAKIVRKP
jgi:hypothetical protein